MTTYTIDLAEGDAVHGLTLTGIRIEGTCPRRTLAQARDAAQESGFMPVGMTSWNRDEPGVAYMQLVCR